MHLIMYHIDLIRPFEKQDVLCYCVVRVGVCKMVTLNISKDILCIPTKFCTQELQGKMKTKFEPGDLKLIFKVTEVI